MNRLRVRELFGEERLLAADLVRTWGYPRSISAHELLLGHWFVTGAGSLFWLTPNAETGPGELAVHVRAYPGSRDLFRMREWQAVLLVLGDLLGVARFKVGIDTTEPRLASVLRRLGWTEDAGRWYLSVEG